MSGVNGCNVDYGHGRSSLEKEETSTLEGVIGAVKICSGD
jgi:hypothetical protein